MPPRLHPQTLALSTLCVVLCSACGPAATPSSSPAAPTAPAPVPLLAPAPTTLDAAEAALQRHERGCDTQRAVLHARQAMATGEQALGSADQLWHDLEVLTAQCEANAQPLRNAVQALQSGKSAVQPPAAAPHAQP